MVPQRFCLPVWLHRRHSTPNFVYWRHLVGCVPIRMWTGVVERVRRPVRLDLRFQSHSWAERPYLILPIFHLKLLLRYPSFRLPRISCRKEDNDIAIFRFPASSQLAEECGPVEDFRQVELEPAGHLLFDPSLGEQRPHPPSSGWYQWVMKLLHLMEQKNTNHHFNISTSTVIPF